MQLHINLNATIVQCHDHIFCIIMYLSAADACVQLKVLINSESTKLHKTLNLHG